MEEGFRRAAEQARVWRTSEEPALAKMSQRDRTPLNGVLACRNCSATLDRAGGLWSIHIASSGSALDTHRAPDYACIESARHLERIDRPETSPRLFALPSSSAVENACACISPDRRCRASNGDPIA